MEGKPDRDREKVTLTVVEMLAGAVEGVDSCEELNLAETLGLGESVRRVGLAE